MAVRVYRRARDGATIYAATYYGPDGTRRVERVRTVPADSPRKAHDYARTAAEKRAQDQRAAVESETWTDPRAKRPAALTFSDLADRFLSTYRSRSGRMDYYRARLAVWTRYIGSRPAVSVTAEEVERLCKRRGAAVGPTTLRQDLIALSTLMRWARARGYVRENPADPDLVKRPPKPNPDPHPLSDGEVVALLDACERAPDRKPDAKPNPRARKKPWAEGEIGYPWLRPVVEFALATGTDRCELLALNWYRHVDRDRKLLRLPRAKTGVDRALPYSGNATLRRLLDEAWKVRHPSGAVFLHDGEPIKLQAAKTAMRRVWTRAGLTKPRPWKTLRATFATRKAEAGIAVPVIAALMGLTTAHVLEHYVKPSGLMLASAMAEATPIPLDASDDEKATTRIATCAGLAREAAPLLR